MSANSSPMRGDVSKVDQSEDTINMELNSLEKMTSDDNSHSKGDPAHMDAANEHHRTHACKRNDNSNDVTINSFNFNNNLEKKFDDNKINNTKRRIKLII
jgi:hypothetical protein